MSLSPSLVREIAEEAGFELVGFGPAHPGEDGARFMDWLDAGRAGEMDYLERNRDRIADPQRWLPEARSTIALAYDYSSPPRSLPDGGRIARYAAGRDYHRFLGKRVQRLRERLEHAGMPRGTSKIGTDAAPVLERALATRAGIGFLAKSAGVISPTHGPYLLLSEVLTTIPLPHDMPSPGSCGTCRACLDACPTGAIVAPFQVDARRCLSYTTIELRGSIPEPLRSAQGEWFFGCDVCLEVCPFTSKGRERGTDLPDELHPHRAATDYGLVEVLELDPETYDEHWRGTAMRRATRSGLRRNAAVVLGNRGDGEALPALERCLADPDPVVREHSAWAIGRIDPHLPGLERALQGEADERVRSSLQDALRRR